MEDLIDKFGATETISKTISSPSKTTKTMEVDISYPSFLDFFAKKRIELSQGEVVEKMEKAKQKLAERIELAKAEYCPQFYYEWSRPDSSSSFDSSDSFPTFSSSEDGNSSPSEHSHAGWNKVEFNEFKEAEGETAVDRLIEDVTPIIQESWWEHENEREWVKIAWQCEYEWEKRSRKWDKLFTLQTNKKSSSPTISLSAEVSDKESSLAKSSHRGVLYHFQFANTY